MAHDFFLSRSLLYTVSPPTFCAEKQWNTKLVGVGDTFNRKLIQNAHLTEAYKQRAVDVRRSKMQR